MTKPPKVKAPFPAIGGKSRVADLVWERFGDVDNYIEPFCFSAAVLLRRLTCPRIETLNDLNCYVANFWRAVKSDPEGTAAAADWPVNEADLHARHRYLVLTEDAKAFREKVRTDPDYFDPKFAGWWAWGACCWIGNGWCPDVDDPVLHQKRPKVVSQGNKHGRRTHDGCGVHSAGEIRLSQQMPTAEMCATGGKGVNGVAPLGDANRPQLADAFSRGRGVNGNDRALTCDERRAWLADWFGRLADRLRVVRVCCGHWLRVCDSPSVTTRLGVTGVFLDPPYPTHTGDGKKSRAEKLYATDRGRGELDALRDEVLAYCRERGSDPKMRVAVCGLDTDGYAALEDLGWTAVPWTSSGYQNVSAGGKANARRERIWFSPHCRNPEAEQFPLFDNLIGTGPAEAP